MSKSIMATQEQRIGLLAATTALFLFGNIAIGVYSRHVADLDLREVEARTELLSSLERRTAAAAAVAASLSMKDAPAIRASVKSLQAADAASKSTAIGKTPNPHLRAAAAAASADVIDAAIDAAEKLAAGDREADSRTAAAASAAVKFSADLESNAEAARNSVAFALAAARERLASEVEAAVLLSVVCAILCVVLGALVRKNLFRPLRNQVSAMRRLAADDSDFAIEGVGAEMPGDLGDMARAILRFKDTIAKKRHYEAEAAATREVVERERRLKDEQDAYYAKAHVAFMSAFTAALEKLSAGNVKHRISAPFIEEYEGLRHSFNSAAERIEQAIVNIVARSGEIRGGADRMMDAAEKLSMHIEEQASSLEETSASMEQMAATIRQNAGNAQEASIASRETRDLAIASGRVAERAVTAMEKIERSSRQATEIVSVIEEIAFQTNILALNAAVEAARAGDAGKGFAVVANEVRALSQRSSRSLKDIKSLIDSSGSDIAVGVGLVKQAGSQLLEILVSVKKASDLVAEIAAASHEQAAGADQVSRAVANMDDMTQQNAGLLQDTTASLVDAKTSIGDLHRVLAVFDVGGIGESVEAEIDDDWRRRAHRSGGGSPMQAAPKRARRASRTAARSETYEHDWQEL